MSALALLLCATLAAEPAAAPPPAAPPAAREDWDETTPPAAPIAPPVAEAGEPQAPPPAAQATPGPFPITMAGAEVLVPRKRSGRLLEQPLAVALESERRLAPSLVGGIQGRIGYAQLTRTEACTPELTFCRPLLSVSIGGALRLATRAGRAVVGWIGLGAGISAALNWELELAGVYGRADAGLDLRIAGYQVRLAAGWVEGASTSKEPSSEPGPQRYLAFTLAAWPR